MSAAASEFPFDGRETPDGVQEHVSPGRRIIRTTVSASKAVGRGVATASGWVWKVVRNVPSATLGVAGFTWSAFQSTAVGLWRLGTPLVRGLVVTALATSMLFGPATAIHIAMWGLMGVGAFAVIGETISLFSYKRRARRDRKIGDQIKAELHQQVENASIDDLFDGPTLAPVSNDNEENIDMNITRPVITEGTEVYMVWTEKQYRAMNDRKHYLENELSKAQETDDKAKRSEFLGRLHMLLRRWHLDERSPRTMRDDLKVAQLEHFGESECGRRYNWNQVLTAMKDEDEKFTPMMAKHSDLRKASGD